jgi:transposase
VGLVDSWRADSQSLSMAQSRNYLMCKNASLDLILAIRFSRDLREDRMRRFVEGADRGQTTLLPECLEDWIGEDNTVRVIDVFVEELDLAGLGFGGVDPEATGRPSYHPSVLLKLYIYGYLNRVQSSRRLEHEAGRNVEVMWLTGRLAPDHKTIADFRKDNGTAIRKVCARFVALCRTMGLLTQASVAIDGSKFKAVNNRDKNFTRAKMERRMAQIEESVARYLQQLDSADRQEPSEALKTKTSRLKEKIENLKEQMRRLEDLKVQMLATPDQQISLTDPDSRSMATQWPRFRRRWLQCPGRRRHQAPSDHHA